MKAIKLIIVVLIFSCNQTTNNRIDYLAQKPPVDSAEIFAPGIISTGSFEHSASAFSPDGKTVLWTVMEMPSYHTRLLEMNYVSGKWSDPIHLRLPTVQPTRFTRLFHLMVNIFILVQTERRV